MKNPIIRKATLLITSLFLLAISGCTKESPTDPLSLNPVSENFMKFKVDGNQKMYDPLFANIVPLNNISVGLISENSLGIVGMKDPIGDDGKKNSMTLTVILVEDNLKIQANTEYNNKDIETDENGIPSMVMGLHYFDENGSEYASSMAKEIKIYFTEITDTSVKGNFSGAIINSNFETTLITDGEFNAANFQ